MEALRGVKNNPSSPYGNNPREGNLSETTEGNETSYPLLYEVDYAVSILRFLFYPANNRIK